MGVIFTESDELRNKGESFINYSQELSTLLNNITANIEIVSESAMCGTAVNALISTYDDISSAVKTYITEIEDLGEVIINTANERAHIDDEAAIAARGVN